MIILLEFLNSRYKRKITIRWMSILTKTRISKLENGDVDEEEVDIEVIEEEQPWTWLFHVKVLTSACKDSLRCVFSINIRLSKYLNSDYLLDIAQYIARYYKWSFVPSTIFYLWPIFNFHFDTYRNVVRVWNCGCWILLESGIFHYPNYFSLLPRECLKKVDWATQYTMQDLNIKSKSEKCNF